MWKIVYIIMLTISSVGIRTVHHNGECHLWYIQLLQCSGIIIIVTTTRESSQLLNFLVHYKTAELPSLPVWHKISRFFNATHPY